MVATRYSVLYSLGMLQTIMSQQEGEFDGLTMFFRLDSAFLGIGESHTSKPRAIYSEELIIRALEAQGMDWEDAWEYYEHNIKCMYIGEQTPYIVTWVPSDFLPSTRGESTCQK